MFVMSKKNVQMFLTEDETFLLNEAAVRSGVTDMRGFLSGKGRALLLAWAFEALGKRGGVRGGTCSGCEGAGEAGWLNTLTRLYVCDTCAQRLNTLSPGTRGPHELCVLGGPDRRYLSAGEYEAVFERVLAAEVERRAAGTERQTLLTALTDAARAFTDYERGGSPNADLVGLFKTQG